MHPWLAKALDWGVIRLACRFVRNDPDPPAASPLPLTPGALFQDAVAAPADLSLSALGDYRFSSPIETAAPENNVVYGRLFPAGRDWFNRPSAILLHGWNADVCYRRMFPRLAAGLNRSGVNVAAIELPYHMQRRPRRGPVTDFISSDPARMLEATRQAVAEIRALCRWLEAQGSPGVGVWGYSLGAWLAGLTACTDPNLHWAVLATPIARIDRVIQELPFCRPIGQSVRRQKLDLTGLNLSSRLPLLDRRRILLVQSRYDLFAPVETIEELWTAWQQPVIWRLPHGHISLLLSKAAQRHTVAWVAEQAKSPSPRR